MAKFRLDQLVFERGLADSRERAKATVMSGSVFVDGRRVDKPGTQISPDSVIEIHGETLPYVSRGGLKLEKALSVFAVNPSGMVCADFGASTGGFTDCLLQNGAVKVYAIDVGYGQLAWKLRSDERVVVMERTNARLLTPDMFPVKPELAVMDLSFISLRLVLPAVKMTLTDDGQVICLIKPQFEAGRGKVGKKGVVRDPGIHLEVMRDFTNYSGEYGFTVVGLSYSPITGPEGNIEYLGYLKSGEYEPPKLDLGKLITDSHSALER